MHNDKITVSTAQLLYKSHNLIGDRKMTYAKALEIAHSSAFGVNIYRDKYGRIVAARKGSAHPAGWIYLETVYPPCRIVA